MDPESFAQANGGLAIPNAAGVLASPALVRQDVPVAPLRSPPGLFASLRAFVTLAEKTLRARMVYRLSTLLSMLASAGGYCIFLLVWSEVYRHQGNTLALPPSQAFPYLVAAFVLNFTLASSLEGRAGLRIARGLITADLSKPMGFMPWHLAQAVGDSIGNALLALPIAILGLASLGYGLVPPHMAAACLGFGSIALGFLVNFAISFLTIQAFFLTDSYYGVAFTRLALHQAFSGLSAPLVLFPEPLRSLAACLPFRHVIEIPARVWLGQVGGVAALHWMFQQALWAMGLLLLGHAVFRVAVRRVQIQGG
jgi:ABC-2 type transport system permease protein